MSSNHLTVLGMFLTVVISISSAWVTNLVSVGKQEERLTSMDSKVQLNTSDIRSSNKRINTLESENAASTVVSNRLIKTLDNLDKTMGIILVKDAVQDEKIKENTSKIEKIEEGG